MLELENGFQIDVLSCLICFWAVLLSSAELDPFSFMLKPHLPASASSPLAEYDASIEQCAACVYQFHHQRQQCQRC